MLKCLFQNRFSLRFSPIYLCFIKSQSGWYVCKAKAFSCVQSKMLTAQTGFRVICTDCLIMTSDFRLIC